MRDLWVTLPPGWKLQDVQAALNVIIGFLCAASVFVLVRHFWVLAAKQVAKKRDVPAYALLSLNTIGESIDIIWLLRYELLTARYRSLLLQCIFVVFLTACTLSSGFLARFSTRSVYIIQQRPVLSSLAARDETSLLNDILDVSAGYHALKAADFPQTKIPEFWPDPNVNWTYNDAQWNSSWTMDCTYQDPTPVPNPKIVTDVCGDGTWEDFSYQFPPINDSWADWPQKANNPYYDYNFDWISYQDNGTVKDVYLFAHGVETLEYHVMGVAPDNYTITTSLNMQTVAFHLSGIPAILDDENPCLFAKGPMQSADFTSAKCHLTRNLGNRTAKDLYDWGSGPDLWYRISRTVSAYKEFWAGRLRRESTANLPVTTIPGTDLVTLYQSYQLTKDTSGTLNWNITQPSKPKVIRDIDVRVRAAQVSLTCLVVCGVMAAMILIGIAHYWWFILRNLKRLDQTPQSKLDWMLHTLRTESSTVGKGSGYAHGHINAPSIDHNDPNVKIRHKLRNSVLVGSQADLNSDAVPLTVVTDEDRKGKTASIVSVHSVDKYGYYDSPAMGGSDYSGHTITPQHGGADSWNYHGQYQQVGVHTPQYFDSRQGSMPGLGILGGRAPSQHGRYERVGSLSSPYEGYGQMNGMDTAYDPGRR